MPLRFTLLICVLNDNSHPAISIFIHWSTQDPNARVLHLYNRINAFGRSELENFHLIRSRNRTAVQCHYIELMARQGQLNGFGSACVQDAKHHSLTFLNAYWISISEASTVNGKSLVADFPAVGFLSLIGLYF